MAQIATNCATIAPHILRTAPQRYAIHHRFTDQHPGIRDHVWAYERSTQGYLAIKQNLAEPDPLRLAWRDFIKQTIREVIRRPQIEPLSSIQRAVADRVPEREQEGVQALVIEELRRVHEGVLERYGLRPSEYTAWKAVQEY